MFWRRRRPAAPSGNRRYVACNADHRVVSWCPTPIDQALFERRREQCAQSRTVQVRLDRHELEAGGMISRRTLLTAAPLAVASCSKAEAVYFGNTDPPRTQTLICLLDHEPGSLDPTFAEPRQDHLILSMFEGLTT